MSKVITSMVSKRNRVSMNFFGFIVLFVMLFVSGQSFAQTTLAAGDIAFLSVNSDNADQFTLVLLVDLQASTVINITDNGFSSTTAGRTGEGFLTFTVPTGGYTKGQTFTWTNGMTISGTPWNSNAPNNFSFNASGDQLFAFQGSTSNWATQSGITLIAGMHFAGGTWITTGTAGASTSYQPSGLSSSFLMSFTENNGYYADGSTSTTSVTKSDTKANLQSDCFDASGNWYKSDTRLTIPSYSITVSSGGLSTPPSITADITSNNVDNNIDIEFTDDATWRDAVSAVKIGGTALTVTTDYVLSTGNLQLIPSGGNSLLTTSGDKSVTIEATGYNAASVTQTINAGAVTANSTATISSALGLGTTRTVTCTAKDQYNNLVSGYNFKFDATVTDNNATTDESYTLNGSAITSSASDVNVSSATNASGVATFDIIIPATVDANDGISVQVQLANGTTNVGSSFNYTKAAPQITLTGSDPASAGFQQGSTNNILYKIQVDVANDVTDLTALDWITGGTYVAADIATNGFKLWYSTDNSFGGDTELDTETSASTGTGEILSFSSFTKQFAIGTAYLFITADLTASATINNTISGEATANVNFSFSESPTYSGSSFTSANSHAFVAGPSVLQAGDIAIISYATDAPDRFAFITFVNINANTEITFTDNGWTSGNTWRTGENTGTYTAPAGGITAGSIIQIQGTTVTGGGTMSAGLTGMSSDGDQLIAYQGASGTPTFITAINMDWDVWQSGAENSNTSAIPTGLTNNVNANAVKKENGYYSGITSGTINFLRSAINNSANWTTDDANQTWPSWSFAFGNQSIVSVNTTVQDLTVANGESLTVNTAKQLTVSGALANNGTLNLLSSTDGTATLKVTGAITGSGTATVQQYLTNQSWYLTSPVTGTVTPTNLSRIQSYNEGVGTGNDWTVSGTTMTAGKGYITNVSSAPNTVEFSGTINSGSISIPLTRQDASDANKYGFNLIGNPYTAYLDWKLVSTANSSKMPTSTMWYRTKVGGSWEFSTINGAGEASPANVSALIPPMQAFWVRASTVGNSTLDLTTNMLAQDNNSTNKLKAPAATQTERSKLRLQVSNGTNTDELLIYTDAQASNDFDWYDSPKMSNESANIPEISCIVGTESLVINGLNAVPFDTELPLGFYAGTEGAYSIKANELINLENVKVVLKDGVNEFDLTNGNTYEFNSAVVNNNSRFSLIFRTTGAVSALDNTKLTNNNVFVNANGEIVVKTSASLSANAWVAVYNAFGQLVNKQSIINSKAIINVARTAGVYFVTVTSNGVTSTQKLIFN